ncbi:MAG: SDR family oxidoreductase [Acidimicrobiia bacterium]|nr:SDR family oxidoreductase [Acidimicrobiia bacterium]
MRVVVAGGAGFLGSHLCDALIGRGDRVVCLDNLVTGRLTNVAHLRDEAAFEFVECDITEGTTTTMAAGPVDAVMHLASAASPPDYFALPLETLAAGSTGTKHLIDLALAHRARFFLASTSEVYGDPLEHPQSESYWGNVNPIGERSVYDEAKRFAEALTAASRRTLGLDACIVRIFNTYGPRMKPEDGRVVSNFVVQALGGEPLTIYGDGTQTRSFCYVDDEIRGFLALLDSDEPGPVNIGNPGEFTMLELADLVIELTTSRSEISHLPSPPDDPARRRPDIDLARRTLGWEPSIDLRTGLERTIPYFSALLTDATP